MSLVVDEHRQYLSDQSRVAAFAQAIAEVVQPGDVVLDLGSGTGILGLLACRAGAQRVYSLEEGGIIDLARAICRANGFQDRVRFIKGFSTRVELPEKVDVAVCDQIGRFGFEAGVGESFHDARVRFLKPGGKLIPRRVDMYVDPVECPEIWNHVEFWNGSPGGFDFRPARSWAANTGYPVKLAAAQLLGEPGRFCSQDLTQPVGRALRGEVRVQARRAGVMHGIGGWFSAQLSGSVTMTNSPLAGNSIHRRNAFFPIDRPISLVPGDCVHISMHIVPTEMQATWTVEVHGPPESSSGSASVLKGKFTHSTLLGMLLPKEVLQRTHPDSVPRLSPWGAARRSILELCDGRRSLAEIEREVYQRHPGLFREPAEAAAFVAEVVTRYAE
jgi:Arginine methyltransferase oligomerization subdomain/Ribosomal protein L11 methyltransferase (PrmA)